MINYEDKNFKGNISELVFQKEPNKGTSRFDDDVRRGVRNKRGCFQDMIEAAYLLKTSVTISEHHRNDETRHLEWLARVYPFSLVERKEIVGQYNYCTQYIITPKFDESDNW